MANDYFNEDVELIQKRRVEKKMTEEMKELTEMAEQREETRGGQNKAKREDRVETMREIGLHWYYLMRRTSRDNETKRGQN